MLGSKLKGYKFKPHTGHGRFSELGQFHLSRFLCIPEYLEETLKAVGPFYVVSVPGEVKYPTYAKMCDLSWTQRH